MIESSGLCNSSEMAREVEEGGSGSSKLTRVHFNGLLLIHVL